MTKDFVLVEDFDDGHELNIGYELCVYDIQTCTKMDPEDILRAISAGKKINGVSNYKRVFEGICHENSGDNTKWIGSFLREEGEYAGYYLYVGKFIFHSNGHSANIGDYFLYFKGRRYFCEDAKDMSCHNPKCYENVTIHYNVLEGFATTITDGKLNDALYYVDNKPCYRFYNYDTDELICSITELMEAESVSINIITDLCSCTYADATNISLLEFNVEADISLLFDGNIYCGGELSYSGEFVLCSYNSEGYIRCGKGIRTVIRSDSVFTEEGIWENNVLKDGYGFVNNIYGVVRNFRIDIPSSFNSIFTMKEGYEVIEISFRDSSIIDGTLIRDGVKLGVGRFDCNYCVLKEALILLLTDITDNTITAQVPTLDRGGLLTINLLKGEDGTYLKIKDNTIFAEKYYPEFNKYLSISGFIDLVDVIWFTDFYINTPSRQIKVLDSDIDDIMEVFKYQQLSVFGTENHEDGKVDYGEYIIDLNAKDARIEYIYREVGTDCYKIDGAFLSAIYDIGHNQIKLGDININLRKRHKDPVDITDIYEAFTHDLQYNVSTIDIGDHHFQGDIECKIKYHLAADVKDHLSWEIEGLLYQPGFKYEGSFIVYKDGSYCINYASGISQDAYLLKYISHDKTFVVDRLTHTIKCSVSDRDMYLHYVGDIPAEVYLGRNGESLRDFFNLKIMSHITRLIGSFYTNDCRVDIEFCRSAILGTFIVQSTYISGKDTPIIFIDDDYVFVFEDENGQFLHNADFIEYTGWGVVSRIDLTDPTHRKECCFKGYLNSGKCDGQATIYKPIFPYCSNLLKYILKTVNA